MVWLTWRWSTQLDSCTVCLPGGKNLSNVARVYHCFHLILLKVVQLQSDTIIGMAKVMMVNIIGQCVCLVPVHRLLAQFDLFSFSLCPYNWPQPTLTDHPVNDIYERYLCVVGLDDFDALNNALDDDAFLTDMILSSKNSQIREGSNFSDHEVSA